MRAFSFYRNVHQPWWRVLSDTKACTWQAHTDLLSLHWDNTGYLKISEHSPLLQPVSSTVRKRFQVRQASISTCVYNSVSNWAGRWMGKGLCKMDQHLLHSQSIRKKYVSIPWWIFPQNWGSSWLQISLDPCQSQKGWLMKLGWQKMRETGGNSRLVDAEQEPNLVVK